MREGTMHPDVWLAFRREHAALIARGWTAREFTAGGTLILHFPKYTADWHSRHRLEITPAGTLIFWRS